MNRRRPIVIIAWPPCRGRVAATPWKASGDLSRDFVHGGTTTSVTTTTLPQAGGGMALTGLSAEVIW